MPRENMRGPRGSPWRTPGAEERLWAAPVFLFVRMRSEGVP
jgi:hypothetical protein